MGFFDVRCAVTGLSLRGCDALAVIVARAGNAYQPIALPLAGNYNRYGAVDGVKLDANGRLIRDAVRGWLRAGRWQVSPRPSTTNAKAADSLDPIVSSIAQGAYSGTPVQLDGAPLHLVLIDELAAKALAKPDVRSDEPGLEALIELAFPRCPTAREVYQQPSIEKARVAIARDLVAFVRLRRWLDAHGGFTPDEEPGQFHAETELELLPSARERVAGHAGLVRVVRDYQLDRESELG